MFGGDKKIKLDEATYEKVRLAAEVSGASSIEEFVQRVLLAEADRILSDAGKGDLSESEIADIENKLKGLGYIE